MSDCQEFPNTWEEFEQWYGFEDKKEIYTNRSRLIQSFRVKQWLDHTVEPERTAKVIDNVIHVICCEKCKRAVSIIDNYCPGCGAKLDWSEK